MKHLIRIIFYSALLACTSAMAGEQLLIDNVNGYTLNAEGRLLRFQAMLVKDGKVSALGDRASMAGWPIQRVPWTAKERRCCPD